MPRLIAFTPQAANMVKLELLDDDGAIVIERHRCKSDTHPVTEMIRRTFFMSPRSVQIGYRVSLDPDTGEIAAPRWFGEQRGRPPVGARAMTGAERAKRYRLRRKEEEA